MSECESVCAKSVFNVCVLMCALIHTSCLITVSLFKQLRESLISQLRGSNEVVSFGTQTTFLRLVQCVYARVRVSVCVCVRDCECVCVPLSPLNHARRPTFSVLAEKLRTP